jgi:hypothetical protein
VKNGVLRLVIVPRYSDVSVNIAVYTLFNNIVSRTIYSVVVCVDLLGTHMANLVLFLKPGVTRVIPKSGIDTREALVDVDRHGTPPPMSDDPTCCWIN